MLEDRFLSKGARDLSDKSQSAHKTLVPRFHPSLNLYWSWALRDDHVQVFKRGKYLRRQGDHSTSEERRQKLGFLRSGWPG